jgi:putative phage-type endonuclease
MEVKRKRAHSVDAFCIVQWRNTRHVDRVIVVPATVNTSEEQDDHESVDAEDLDPQMFYDRFIKVTPDDLRAQLAAPQRSPEWHAARKYCLTASAFGAAAGHNAFCSPDALVKEKLWSTFKGNYATEYGTAHEDDARFEFEAFARNSWPDCRLETPNLIKGTDRPWMAVSPDGLLFHNTDEGLKVSLVEYKCPMNQTDGHPYNKYDHCIPPYYMDQIQGIMGFLNDGGFYKIEDAFFVVWQQSQTWIMRVPFDKVYWTTVLYPKLHEWFFVKYLPALVHKHNGDLEPGQINAGVALDISEDRGPQ